MEKKIYTLVFALGLSLVSFGLFAQTGNPAQGEQEAAICAACHQPNGQGMNIPGGESWPSLAGLNASYLAKQLHDFKTGKRTNASMLPFATMLNDQQILDLAAYYASLPALEVSPANEDSDLLNLGKKLAETGDWDRYIVPCASCHGPSNQGAGEHFPAIAGQHPGYIEAQLLAWQDGSRANDPQDLMLAIAKRMTKQDIKAVAAWLASQPAK